jgi:alpha-tubulin suppressor-like RCC1 family protein
MEHPVPCRCGALTACLAASALFCLAAVTTPVAQSPPIHVVKVVGDAHVLALTSDGTVVGWGRWNHGQLGPIAALSTSGFWTSRPASIDLPGKAIDVAAGENTSYALMDDGSVWAWGDGRWGELGTGPKPNLPLLAHSTSAMEYRGVERPVRVAVDNVAKISASGGVAFAVLRDRSVRQWPRRGSDGSSTFLPVPVPGLDGIVQVAPGWSHVLALDGDGRVLAWGNNRYGALGREPKEDKWNDEPTVVPGLGQVAAIAAAGDVSFALQRDGTVWVWGSNGQGQFGNGQRAGHPSANTVSTPARVAGVSHAVWLTAATTGRHVVVLLEDGTLRAWGNTDFGQIGAGLTATFQLSPVTPKIAGVKAVFAVGNQTYAVKTDGTFWGWGTGDKERWPFQASTKVPTLLDLK